MLLLAGGHIAEMTSRQAVPQDSVKISIYEINTLSYEHKYITQLFMVLETYIQVFLQFFN